MNKLKVGMYVRHKCGNGGQTISRCTKKVNIANNVFYIHTDIKGEVLYKSNILKASHNIIDLIEAGDYVNGRKVYKVGYDYIQDEFILKMSESDYEDFIYPKRIKSIVTKEQFKSMEYKVGGNSE